MIIGPPDGYNGINQFGNGGEEDNGNEVDDMDNGAKLNLAQPG